MPSVFFFPSADDGITSAPYPGSIHDARTLGLGKSEKGDRTRPWKANSCLVQQSNGPW